MSKEEKEIISIIIAIVIAIIIFMYLFGSITINQLTIKVNNGNITSASLKERSVSRLNSLDSSGSGYYDVLITAGNETLKSKTKTGTGDQIYSIKKYVQCLNVTLSNSDNQVILETLEVCKK